MISQIALHPFPFGAGLGQAVLNAPEVHALALQTLLQFSPFLLHLVSVPLEPGHLLAHVGLDLIAFRQDLLHLLTGLTEVSTQRLSAFFEVPALMFETGDLALQIGLRLFRFSRGLCQALVGAP